jgi:hypothetical protein
LLFADNSKKFMDSFSSEFHNEYINTLKRRFNTKRVHANIVYQEYINDRNHIHMNSTRWLTLTDYVNILFLLFNNLIIKILNELQTQIIRFGCFFVQILI